MSVLENFNQYFTAVKSAAGDVSRNAVRQTKSLAAIGKTKVAVASEEDRMKKAYTELGRLYFRDYDAGTEPDPEEYRYWCEQIAEARAQVSRLTEDIARIRESASPSSETLTEDAVTEVSFAPDAEEADEAEIVLVTDAAEQPEAPADTTEAPAEVPEAPVDVPEANPEAPTVGTLFVDVSGEE